MPLTTFLQRIADIHAHTPCPKAAHEAMEAEVRTCAAALRQHATTTTEWNTHAEGNEGKSARDR